MGEERKRKKREKGQDRVPGVPRGTGFGAQSHQGEEVGGGKGREGEGRSEGGEGGRGEDEKWEGVGEERKSRTFTRGSHGLSVGGVK